MNSSARRLSGFILAALLLLVFSSSFVRAQDSQSSALVKELTALLDQNKLDSIAAKEANPDAYVAALYFPGQLMVVGARYKEPVLLNERIAKKEFRDVYIDLNSASLPNTKCLITDLGADGLKAKADEGKPFDSIERADGKEIRFNSDWKAQKLTEDEYMKAFAESDARYVKMLQALIAQVKKTS